MEVKLSDISKHFGREVVFRGVSRSLASGSRTAILGPNGSGKSTLLQVIGGALVPTEGTIEHRIHGRTIPQEEVYRHVSIAAPYLGLYEDLSLRQAVEFHARFKPLRAGLKPADVARIAYLDQALEKPVLHFSSGMKQRLKLALAILSDTPLLLLDEPASNLDAEAIAWYRALLGDHLSGRTLLVASNRQAAEHDLCADSVEISTFKQ
jgi:ABC-type multidrug transport system ATPase subunit